MYVGFDIRKPMSQNDDVRQTESTPTRRSVLGAVGATMATAALSGVGAARGDSLQAKRARALSLKASYGSRDAVAAALDEHASDLLSDLADRGLLDAGDASALDLGEPRSVDEYRAAIEQRKSAVHVGGVEATDGTVTAHVSTSVWTDQGRLSIHVQPEAGEAHAAFRDGDDGGGTVFRDSGGDVEPQPFCEYSCSDCQIENCSATSSYRAYEEYCCTYSDGSTDCDPTGDPCDSCC
jgi:hypothetical protein